MATVMDGKLVSSSIREQLTNEINHIKGRKPTLATILVGEDESAKIYIKNKEKACMEVGIESSQYYLPEHVSELKLVECITRLNMDPGIDGILIQMPLPRTFSTEKIIEMIHPEKDVDCLHPLNMGLLMTGHAVFTPNTPQSVLSILDFYHIPLQGKKAVVIGRSNIVGKPLSFMLLDRNATVTICHSKTTDLSSVAREADILIAAIGRPEMITRDFVKPGAVVCDVGINYVDGKIKGDVDYKGVSEIASFITPVPGGVGSLTTTLLLQNTLKAYRLHH